MKAKQSWTCEIYWHIYKSGTQKDTATNNHFRIPLRCRFLGRAQSAEGIFVEWLNKQRFAAISIFPSSWRGWRGGDAAGVAVRSPAPLRSAPVDFWEQHFSSSWLLPSPGAARSFRVWHLLFAPAVAGPAHKHSQGGRTLESPPNQNTSKTKLPFCSFRFHIIASFQKSPQSTWKLPLCLASG